MNNNIILIGNKNYKNLKLNNIIDYFDNNIRFNFGLPNNNNGTKFDNIILNNHVFNNSKKSLEKNISIYCSQYSISKEYVTTFHKSLCKYNKILKQSNNWTQFNSFLSNNKCPYKFTHLPRIGYIQLMNFVLNDRKVFVYGFSIEDQFDKHLYKYDNVNTVPTKSKYHNWDVEIKILHWLHNNNFIDATLCFIEDTETPTINCKFIKPSIKIITLILKYYDVCILKDYINKNTTYTIHKIFDKNKCTFNNNNCIILA